MKNKKLTYYLEDMSIKCVILSEFILLCVILGQNVKTISSDHGCSDDNLFHRRTQSINSVCFIRIIIMKRIPISKSLVGKIAYSSFSLTIIAWNHQFIIFIH